MKIVLPSFSFFLFIAIQLIFAISLVNGQHQDSSDSCVMEFETQNFGNKIRNQIFDNNQSMFKFSRFEPFIFDLANEASTMSLEIGITDPNVEYISLRDGLCYQWEIGDEILLFDNGLDGDKIANDGIFTAASFRFKRFDPWLSRNNPSNPDAERITYWMLGAGQSSGVNRQEITIHYKDGSTEDKSVYLSAPCGAINTNYIPTTEVINIDGTAQYSSHVLNVVMPINDNEFPFMLYPYSNNIPISRYGIADVAKRALNYVEDEYDWIIIHDITRNSQQYWSVRRSEDGVFESKFDFSTSFGNSRKLRGLIYDQGDWRFTRGDFNSSPGRGNVYSILMHEILHTWSAYLPNSLNLSSPSSHWDYIQKPSTCFHGYGSYPGIAFDPESKTVTFHHNTSNRSPCNDLELYLMGLIPAEELSPTKTLVNTSTNINDQFQLVVTADDFIEVTANDIIASIGPRNPSYENAPKEFKALMVVAYERLLTVDEMSFFNFRMSEFEKTSSPFGMNFYESVSGNARISTKVEPRSNPLYSLADKVELLEPGGQSVDIAESPIFRWSVIENAEYYQLQISKDSLFSFINLITDTKSYAGFANASLIDLVPGNTYYWRVRGINPSGGGIWSEIGQFDIINTSISSPNIGDYPKRTYLSQNYPNPFNPTTKIKFSLDYSGPISVDVYDLSGKFVAKLFSGFKTEGSHEINFEGAGLASGLYLYILQTENTRLTKTMLLLK